MNRRVEIILDIHKEDHYAAMGELNVRKNELEKRLLSNWVYGKERIAIRGELDDIYLLLKGHQKPAQLIENKNSK